MMLKRKWFNCKSSLEITLLKIKSEKHHEFDELLSFTSQFWEDTLIVKAKSDEQNLSKISMVLGFILSPMFYSFLFGVEIEKG